MSNITFKELLKLAEQLDMESELLESFSFACRVRNLNPSTLKCYAERLAYLLKYVKLVKRNRRLKCTNRDLL